MTTQNSINNASPNIAAHSVVISEAANAQVGVLLGLNQILLGQSGADPIATTLPGTVLFVDQASSSVTMAVNTTYLTDNGATLVTYTLPATAVKGSIVEIVGFSSGGWTIIYSTGQLIHYGNVTTTTTSGSLSSSNTFDNVKLMCTVTNTTWTVMSGNVGNLTYV